MRAPFLSRRALVATVVPMRIQSMRAVGTKEERGMGSPVTWDVGEGGRGE